ncbi:gluconate:H+ symporter [Chitinophaga rhizosphaerae]|uniref:gluconate:H+ symporter n=1 Tax=Chitinophaga rhizosphaerae TaxID=1864947 RepID=UPI000F814DE4|nr:gluconate:H+ symporter [Chitinophaga rhizosphaerae]
MAFVIVAICIVILVMLLTWGKMNAFLAFLLVSLIGGAWLGLPPPRIPAALQKGIGDTVGGLLSILALGAMLGKLVAESGAARQIAQVLVGFFGPKYVQWALMVAGFIIGIPLYYGVGFVLMVPLIFSVIYRYKLPAVATGLPALAALSVTHGFLPPHPSPVALVSAFGADMGKTLVYGLAVAIPAIVIAGPLFSIFLRRIPAGGSALFRTTESGPADVPMPGKAASFFTALLPVLLLMAGAAAQHFFPGTPGLQFAADPAVVMLFCIFTATVTLGIMQGRDMTSVMRTCGEAVKDIAPVLLVIAGSGALKQVLTETGVSERIAGAMQLWPVPPLVLGWVMAAIIRACVGSATIAGLTAAGMLAPIVNAGLADPNLMVLSVGAGSLMFSHVNDAGFWMFREYFSLSIKSTLLSWSVMETLVGVAGLAGVLLLNSIL